MSLILRSTEYKRGVVTHYVDKITAIGGRKPGFSRETHPPVITAPCSRYDMHRRIYTGELRIIKPGERADAIRHICYN